MTQLAVIGAGAGGLMAAAAAGRMGVRCLLVERKSQFGRKLLMCANNRCNLTNDLGVEEMVAAYGPPVCDFLVPAIRALPPAALRSWFADAGLRTCVHKDGKVFPWSEKSADVLNTFSHQLRMQRVSLLVNTAVTAIRRSGDHFTVEADNLSLQARHVLIATGGVSYPKTGSVGDGQRFARALGHKVTPYRPGLVGLDIAETWLTCGPQGAFPGTSLTVLCDDRPVGITTGEVEFSRRGLRGPAVVDASRMIARSPGRHKLIIDLCPQFSAAKTAELIAAKLQQSRGDLVRVLGDWIIPGAIVKRFIREVIGSNTTGADEVAHRIKNWTLTVTRPRPLKEAMVTVGGVDLGEVNPDTMESRLVRGLYFCGEVLDIDGPTGGFNLHAAFATAQLAVRNVAARTGAAKTDGPVAGTGRGKRREYRR